MNEPLPMWIDLWVPVRRETFLALRRREGGGWRVCLDDDRSPERVFVRVVKVTRQPGGHLAAKIELVPTSESSPD